MTKENEPVKVKEVPAFYIFEQIEKDGEKQSLPVGAAFPHKKGNGLTLLIDGKRLAAFPPKRLTESQIEMAL